MSDRAQPKAVVQESSVEGLDQDGFARDVQEISALALFAKALPGWCRQHRRGVRIVFECAGDGVAINIGVPDGTPSAVADDLLGRLRDWDRLQALELLVSELRNAGVSPDIIDPMIDEAEALAHKLSPPEEIVAPE